jgi:two-component system, NtrC family, nitrogen regulation sensor histidine kinase NtrY
MASRERTRSRKKVRRKLTLEQRVLVLALAAGLIGVIVSTVLILLDDYTLKTALTLLFLIYATWIGFAVATRNAIMRPLQTLSNIQSALREGDYSIRLHATRSENDSLSELVHEVNALSDSLREQRLGALEASALLRKIMSEIDVAIFAFDENQRLRLVNRSGERLLGLTAERAIGRTAVELELDDVLASEPQSTMERQFPGASGRWGIRRSDFRQGGIRHELVVVSDLSRALREEERQAWQRLVRVLAHELNNSLAPVQSIASSLDTILRSTPRPADWEDDVQKGVRVISDRAESLGRFMRDYARLARLPKPQPRPLRLLASLERIATLETRVPVKLIPGPDLMIEFDPDQFEQLMINVLKNAAEASLESKGSVELGWEVRHQSVVVFVRDEGPGILNPSNLFVPFFTTKPGGAGIGLALSRQIAEAHGGTLNLHNRRDTQGCEAALYIVKSDSTNKEQASSND